MKKLPAFLILICSGLIAAEKPRIFIAGRDPVQITGETASGDAKGSLTVTRSGTASQDVAVLKTFLERCPAVVVTGNAEKADYIVRVNHDEVSPATPFVAGNKIAVFNREDELIYGTSARLLRNAVKDACKAITAHK